MSFHEFYETIYRPRHVNRACFLLHVAGAIACLGSLAFILAEGWWAILWVPLVATYGEAWLGHLVSWTAPASFTHPLYSALSFWLMMLEAASGIFPWDEDNYHADS